MSGRRPRRHLAMLLAGLLVVSGCRSIGGAAGAVAGTASGVASGSPAVGVAIGIGTKAAVDLAIKTTLRRWSREEQEAIAREVGAMQAGERRRWEVRHGEPWGNTHGLVTVLRVFDTPLAPCKEAVFSVAGGEASAAPAERFVIKVCQGGGGWQWAVAEPSVLRWGALQ